MLLILSDRMGRGISARLYRSPCRSDYIIFARFNSGEVRRVVSEDYTTSNALKISSSVYLRLPPSFILRRSSSNCTIPSLLR